MFGILTVILSLLIYIAYNYKDDTNIFYKAWGKIEVLQSVLRVSEVHTVMSVPMWIRSQLKLLIGIIDILKFFLYNGDSTLHSPKLFSYSTSLYIWKAVFPSHLVIR
jgi:hypothetical protein